MNLLIKIEKDKVRVILSDKEKAVDEVDFALDNDLSQKLLPAIDGVFRKNKLEPKDVEKAELEANVPDSYTTFRIAKAVVDAMNWGKA